VDLRQLENSFAVAVLIFIVLEVVVALYLARTTGGPNILAIGGNKESADAVGIPVRRVVLGLSALNGAIVGIAAVITSSFGGAAPAVGVGLELSVLTAVVLGGVSFSGGERNVLGTVLAVVLLTVVNSGIVALNINSYYSGVVSGALLVFAVGLDQFTEETTRPLSSPPRDAHSLRCRRDRKVAWRSG
jgi:ribose/xylose/arabinose/galactoside ABC-type transport system permease subunit